MATTVTGCEWNALKVFSATMARDRDELGEKVTDWLAKQRGITVVETVVTQSSDESFHCLAITLFYRRGP